MAITSGNLRAAAVVALLAVAAVLSTACGGDGDDVTTRTNGEDLPSDDVTGDVAGGDVAIRDFRFEPADLRVAVGSTVGFTNGDAARHTATADDGSFDTGDLDEGGRADVTFDRPGTFAYVCAIHNYMRGTVTVQ